MTILDRWQAPALQSARRTRRVILLEGARQTGKTTMARSLDGQTTYRTLDDIAVRSAVEYDLKAFLENPNGLMVIDEIQKEPDLIAEIKRRVDLDTRPGQYLITGSANITSLPHVTESLAGRIQRIRLRPLTQGELSSVRPSFLTRAFTDTLKAPGDKSGKQHILDRTVCGGYPEVLKLSHRERRRWHRDYINAILTRDLEGIANVRRKDALKTLLFSLALWSGRYMDVTGLSRDMQLNRRTLESYINAFEALFLIDRIPPWTSTEYTRIGKRDKLFMTDSGLTASLLRDAGSGHSFNDETTGKLVETFVYTELVANAECAEEEIELFHYRDNDRREIDFILTNENGDLLAVEVKAGMTVRSDDFKSIRWFRENLAKDRRFQGLVLYSGEDLIRFGEGLLAVPISCLWS